MPHEIKFSNGVCTETVITIDNGDIQLLPDGTGIVYVGTGVPTHLTPTSGELYVQGISEFDGWLYADGGLRASNGSQAGPSISFSSEIDT